MFLTLNISVTRAGIFLWWIETELSFTELSTGLEIKMICNRMLFLTFFRAKNLSYYSGFCYETSRLKNSIQTEMLQTLSQVIFFFLDTCVKQLYLMRYPGCLCDFKRIVVSPKLYLVVHSYFQKWWYWHCHSLRIAYDFLPLLIFV